MRYQPLTTAEMTPRQREVAQAIASRRVGGLSGPYVPLIYSPETADLTQALAEYLRFNLRVPERLRLMAVLMTAARHSSSDTDFFLHAKDIRETGLSDEKIKALSEGRRPVGMTGDEEIVYEFCSQLLKTGRVTTATFEKAVNRFNREVCLELVVVCGNTALTTMMLKVTGTRFPDGDPAD